LKILKNFVIILLAAKAKADEEEVIKASCRRGMRGCGSHVRPLRFLSRLNYSMEEIYYDPNFYEFRALVEIAKIFKTPIQINVNLKDSSSKEQIEIDGLINIKGKEWPIEIKSYPLEEKEIRSIIDKYKHFGFKRLKIVAPNFVNKIKSEIDIEYIEFHPNLSLIREFYKNWKIHLSPRLEEELYTGKHHFRYKLAKRAKNSIARFINQTDKCIKTEKDLIKEINCRIPLNNPPVRIYWSTARWLSPKDLYFKNLKQYCLGQPLVFDIDGSLIHKALFSCIISPKTGLCNYCIEFALLHTKRLIKFLKNLGFQEIEIVFSGRQGFHVYVFDKPLGIEQRVKIIKELRKKKIKVDELITLDKKSIIAFPSSLHGYSIYQTKIIKKIDNFSLNDLEKIC
jgi:hypothetical protein